MSLLDRTISAVGRAAATDVRFHVHYAVKANADKEILEAISRAGLGADCVSGWEIEAAVSAGFPAEKIVFAGVGKTDREIELALKAGIGCFNVESMQELEVIGTIASDLGVTAPVALRVNPNIDAHTHEYITTGLSENKFGINIDQLSAHVMAAVSMPGVSLEGLHFHIGSQITESEPFEMLCETINRIQEEYLSQGISFRNINVGGGLGIDYADPSGHPIPDFDRYFSVFRNKLKAYPDQKVHFELGRSIVAQCGSLITRVLYIKEGSVKRFAIVDAGMT
ncbi:MAG: diaminopimelate decarboxylase, partial [Duncaniella sp.]|nr:diaminopimelate decarboxylase [Duncaniella sp.]